MSETRKQSGIEIPCAPITVILPAYNGERFIRAAIESVQAQTLPVAEIMVIDDGSTDRTADIAEALGAKVIRQTNRGVSAARNMGIRMASNDWIAFIDQDDLWEPEKIACQSNAIKQYPEASIISCYLSSFADESVRDWMDEFESCANARKEKDSDLVYLRHVAGHLPLSRMIDYTSSILIRRDLLMAVGMFDPDLRQNEDLECFLRVVARSSLVIVRQPLVRHRVHDKNTSLGDPEGARASYDQILDRLRKYPDKYPPKAAQAYGAVFSRNLSSTARVFLESGRRREARALFRQSLGRAFSVRALYLWCLSFLPSPMFEFLLSTKRRISTRFAPTLRRPDQ